MFGVFDAKIKEYGVSEANNGNPQVFIAFNFEFEGAQKTLTWYGSFAGGAKKITLKSLIACGLQPQHYGQLVKLHDGVNSGLLDLNKTLSIDVQQEPKQDGSGMRTVVAWVNDPAMAPAIKKIDAAKNAQFFGSMGFEQDLVNLANELNIPLNNGGQATMVNQMNMQNNNPHNQQGFNMGNGQSHATQYNQANNGQSNSGNGFAQNVSNFNQGNGQQQFNQSQGQQQNQGKNGFNVPF